MSVHKSLRMSEQTLQDLQEIKEQHETLSAVMERALVAGVRAIRDGGGEHDGEQADAKVLQAVIEQQEQRISDLKDELERKNMQLDKAQEIAQAAQVIYGQETSRMIAGEVVQPDEVVTPGGEATPPPQPAKQGFLARLFG